MRAALITEPGAKDLNEDWAGIARLPTSIRPAGPGRYRAAADPCALDRARRSSVADTEYRRSL